MLRKIVVILSNIERNPLHNILQKKHQFRTGT